MNTQQIELYDLHMALSRAHATLAQAIRYPMLVNQQALRTARALIEASHVLDRQMSKPQDSQK